MGKRTIDLSTKVNIDPGTGHHRLQAWVSNYAYMDPEIFVYQRYPALPGESSPDDHFVNVASAADLVDYPRTTPVGTAPFFRLSYIDIVFRSVDLLNRTVALIREDIAALIANLDRMDGLGTTNQYDFEGSEQPGLSSSSGTSSSSNSSSSN